MMGPHLLFNYLPIGAIFILTILCSLIAFECGFRIARHTRGSVEQASEAPVGAIVAAILGLLAFILAFTFSSAASRFDERNKLVLEEAIAIDRAYLRAGHLLEPYRTQVRARLRDYIKIRLEGIHPEKRQEALQQSLQIQDELWNYVELMGNKIPMNPLFVQSINDIIALHAQRVMIGVRRHIPNTIWYALYFVTIFAMSSMGYYTGLKKNRFLVISLALMVTFSSVITLIADLDRPQEGSIKVSQQPLIDIYNKIDSQKLKS